MHLCISPTNADLGRIIRRWTISFQYPDSLVHAGGEPGELGHRAAARVQLASSEHVEGGMHLYLIQLNTHRSHGFHIYTLILTLLPSTVVIQKSLLFSGN